MTGSVFGPDSEYLPEETSHNPQGRRTGIASDLPRMQQEQKRRQCNVEAGSRHRQ